MKKSVAFGLVSAVAMMSGISAAQAADSTVGLGAGDLLVHLRVLGAIPQESGHDTLLNGKIELGDSYVPEVDASYFLTDHVAFEIIAGTTQHSVKDKTNTALGTLDLGHVWLLPPTITAQYHPLHRDVIDPYVGAGVNYSIFYNGSGAQNILGQAARVTYKDGWGYALQAGANYDLKGGWFLNVDLKKIFVDTKANVNLNSAGNVTYAKVQVDPWIVGLGVGYRF